MSPLMGGYTVTLGQYLSFTVFKIRQLDSSAGSFDSDKSASMPDRFKREGRNRGITFVSALVNFFVINDKEAQK